MSSTAQRACHCSAAAAAPPAALATRARFPRAAALAVPPANAGTVTSTPASRPPSAQPWSSCHVAGSSASTKAAPATARPRAAAHATARRVKSSWPGAAPTCTTRRGSAAPARG
eukprot:7682946-Lingulodinium_polyedra.AAC.1